MRYMLYQSEDAQVPLDKEIGYLENYVELQRIRFGEDVDIRLHIEGDTNSHVIEPMLMIPFVENAFKHGVGMIPEPIIDIDLLLGRNDLHIPLYDFRTKGCNDGLMSDGVNINQGAESTLSFLLSLLAVVESFAIIGKSKTGKEVVMHQATPKEQIYQKQMPVKSITSEFSGKKSTKNHVEKLT